MSSQMAATSFLISRGSPSCLLHLWEALQEQLVGLTLPPFKLLPLYWDLNHVRFSVTLFRVESLFPTALQFS